MMGGDSRKAHTAWILMRLCEIDPDIILKVPCSTLESLEFLSALLCPMKPISDSYFSNGYLIRYLPFSVVFSDDGVKSLLSKPNHLDLRALFNFLSSNQFILSDRDDDVDLTKFLIYERPQWLPKVWSSFYASRFESQMLDRTTPFSNYISKSRALAQAS